MVFDLDGDCLEVLFIIGISGDSGIQGVEIVFRVQILQRIPGDIAVIGVEGARQIQGVIFGAASDLQGSESVILQFEFECVAYLAAQFCQCVFHQEDAVFFGTNVPFDQRQLLDLLVVQIFEPREIHVHPFRIAHNAGLNWHHAASFHPVDRSQPCHAVQQFLVKAGGGDLDIGRDCGFIGVLQPAGKDDI